MAVSVDSAAESHKLAEKRKIPFPLLSDPEMQVISRYGVADSETEIAIPSIFFVEQGGTVGWVHVGEAIFIRPSSEELLQDMAPDKSEK